MKGLRRTCFRSEKKWKKLAQFRFTVIHTGHLLHPARDSLSVNVKKENVPYAFDGDIHFGVKAKDNMEIYPELVKKDENGFYSVNYIEFIPILISVVQEQNEKIRTLEKIISELKDN